MKTIIFGGLICFMWMGNTLYSQDTLSNKQKITLQEPVIFYEGWFSVDANLCIPELELLIQNNSQNNIESIIIEVSAYNSAYKPVNFAYSNNKKRFVNQFPILPGISRLIIITLYTLPSAAMIVKAKVIEIEYDNGKKIKPIKIVSEEFIRGSPVYPCDY